jgi:hypothetical protein
MLDQLFQTIMSPELEEQTVPSETDPPSNTKTVQADSSVNNIATTETTTASPSKADVYQGSYEFPMESWTPTVQGKSPGLTKELITKPLHLDKINKDFLFSLEKEIATEDINFVHTAFSLLSRKPLIGKKEVDLSNIPSLMKSPEYRKQLIEQALELESDPSLKSEDRLALMQSHQISITKMGMLEHGRKIFNNEIVATAKWAKNNPDFQGPANYFEKIIDGKGNFINEKSYNALLQKEHDDMIAAWEKAHPFPKDGPMAWQRSDFNPTANHVIYNPDTGKYETMDTRPKYANSQEGWYGTREMISQSFWNAKHKAGEYKDVKDALIDAYNHPKSPSTKLRTNYYSKYGPNKGGEVEGEIGTITFDLATKLGVVPLYGPNKGKAIVRPEVVELTNIIQLANSTTTADNGIKVAIGGKTGSSPEKLVMSDDAKKIIQNLWEDISSAPSRKKDAVSRLPKGSITFSSIVAGGEPYYAYNIKFNSDYIKTDRYIGTADNPGPGHATKKSPLFTDGITIYVPKKMATGKMSDNNVVSRLARDNKNASTVSAVEGLFSVKDDVQLTIPSGARLNLIRDPATGDTRVTGWNVILNPNTGKMDTLHMPLQVVPIDRATDLDWIVDDFYRNSFNQLDINDQIMKEISKDKKVFDPKILQHQNQY